ncbi:hypothetical protein [Sphingobium lignivorans]|nr:hypothetical protein [Sphingobium lignivorans]
MFWKEPALMSRMLRDDRRAKAVEFGLTAALVAVAGGVATLSVIFAG